jgi:hypothetical protein
VAKKLTSLVTLRLLPWELPRDGNGEPDCTVVSAGAWGRLPAAFAMTVRTSQSRIDVRRGCRRWAAAVCALAVLLVAPAALASVPMCNDKGQTIEAPLPVFPAKGGEIRAVAECDPGIVQLLQAPVREAPKLQTSGSGLERVLPLACVLPPLPVGKLLPLYPVGFGAPLQAFDSGVYRPPRA